MGRVLIHAGIAKAGSSSIQTWLAEQSSRLRAAGIIVLVAKRPRAGDTSLRLVEHRSGFVNSNQALRHIWASDGNSRRSLFRSLFEKISQAARRHRGVIISSEVFGAFLASLDEAFLAGLEDLGRQHSVRVAYYVRPQHALLEAAWRQWGFRLDGSPSQYLYSRSRSLHYYETYVSARRYAPSVAFEPRPFRRDLLDLGDLVTDFKQRFLDLGGIEVEDRSTWSNPGLPLEVVNALRLAPKGLLWSNEHDNVRLDAVKEILRDMEFTESAEIARSRRVLQAHAHETFEVGNLEMIAAMGWATDSFVPAVEDLPVTDRKLKTIDELWRPRASEAELALLYSAIGHAVASVRAKRSRHIRGYLAKAYSALTRGRAT